MTTKHPSFPDIGLPDMFARGQCDREDKSPDGETS